MRGAARFVLIRVAAALGAAALSIGVAAWVAPGLGGLPAATSPVAMLVALCAAALLLALRRH